MNTIDIKEKKFNKLITVVSIIVPLVVVVLFNVRIPNVAPLSFLPPIYASINGLTALLLIVAVIAILKGNRKLHQRIMTTCIALSLVFLLMYIAYHMTSDPTKFGDEGGLKYIYYFILIWLYVAITGVIVYLMISPYYTH